jgi:hypothetical protein
MPSWAIYGNERRRGISVSADSIAATNFLARTTGLDATHTNAYKALLNGLTTDGIFNGDGTSDYLDILYIFATQDSTTAVLNLVANEFNGTVNSDPTFTADSDYFADEIDDFIATGYNPTTASRNFAQNSAHMGVWNLTNATHTVPAAGNDVTSSGQSNLYVSFAGDFYCRLNDDAGGSGAAVADPRGFLMGNRSASNAVQLYQNGASIGSNTQASGSPFNAAIGVLVSTASSADTVHHIAAFSLGASMDATRADQFYDRLRTYMTAVGVP